LHGRVRQTVGDTKAVVRDLDIRDVALRGSAEED